ncbi:2-haloacid dehalogenase [Stackebrandtia endophytica]|uniref:2-haloacid dehalogenase n=1 Tax=Stackebrandtia endophytica TaxID=1496996 RepID=A0A543AVQ3_9ACTN|nr:haloacid dehalogenase type II [Stackebrandtia endophytica]TQL76666.1 2-haloacid dehalogenase [Stackebrandtia endophytica]
MSQFDGIEAVVFDVLGTLVDEPGGLHTEIAQVIPDDAAAPALLADWQRHVEEQQRLIAHGDRAYADSETIDAEAAQLVAERANIMDPAAVERLATAGQRLPAWGDSVASLDRLAARLPVIGLSNASANALWQLSSHTGLRWHRIVSGEAAGAYKPSAEVYRLAVDAVGCAPDRLLMVAAHAWDLRGAQAIGMRTAYVHRPVGDPPGDTDIFDGRFDDLSELVDRLVV